MKIAARRAADPGQGDRRASSRAARRRSPSKSASLSRRTRTWPALEETAPARARPRGRQPNARSIRPRRIRPSSSRSLFTAAQAPAAVRGAAGVRSAAPCSRRRRPLEAPAPLPRRRSVETPPDEALVGRRRGRADGLCRAYRTPCVDRRKASSKRASISPTRRSAAEEAAAARRGELSARRTTASHRPQRQGDRGDQGRRRRQFRPADVARRRQVGVGAGDVADRVRPQAIRGRGLARQGMAELARKVADETAAPSRRMSPRRSKSPSDLRWVATAPGRPQGRPFYLTTITAPRASRGASRRIACRGDRDAAGGRRQIGARDVEEDRAARALGAAARNSGRARR